MPKKNRQALRHRGGYCLFCNASATSHEHLWPDWMGTFFPDGYKHSEILTRQGTIDAQVSNPEIEKGGGPWTKTFKVVCGKCNYGWMSEIEQTVKPLIMSLALGRNISLGLDDQQNLARWIALKMIVSEFCDLGRNRTQVFDPQDCQDIRKSTPIVPKRFRSWIIRSSEIACWGGRYMRASRGLDRAGLSKAGSARCNAAIGMWGMGELLIVWARAPFDDQKFTFEPSSFMGCQLWPAMYRKIPWPPVAHFTGQNNLASAIRTQRWDLEYFDLAASEAADLIGSPDWMSQYSIASASNSFVVGTPAIYFVPELI